MTHGLTRPADAAGDSPVRTAAMAAVADTPLRGRCVYLVRHGRPHNPRDIAYGFLPRVGLADEGREQARRAGRYLRERAPVAMYSSPLLRAMQTARLIAAELAGSDGCAGRSAPRHGPEAASPVQGSDVHAAGGGSGMRMHRSWLLRESGLARFWQGTVWAELPERFPEEWRLFNETPALYTAGETLAAQADRMQRLLRRAARRYPAGALVFVSHRDPIVALRLRVEGRSFDDLHTTMCALGSITELILLGTQLAFGGYVEP